MQFGTEFFCYRFSVTKRTMLYFRAGFWYRFSSTGFRRRFMVRVSLALCIRLSLLLYNRARTTTEMTFKGHKVIAHAMVFLPDYKARGSVVVDRPHDALCYLKFLIARQHSNADVRYWYSISVHPSVRHAPVLYWNRLTCHHTFFSIW